MNLSITQTYAKIGVETIPASIITKTENARLELSSRKAKIEVSNDFPKVEISSRECFNTSGLKDRDSFMREAVQLGYQAANSYISKVAGDGDSFAAIENGQSPLESIVLRDAYPEHEFNIDYLPKARPQVSVKGGVRISTVDALGGATNGVEGNFTPGKVQYQVSPGNVKIYMLQYPSLDIKYLGNNVDVSK